MIAIRGARLIDPGRFDDIQDIYIENGKILDITPHNPKGLNNLEFKGGKIEHLIDATGKIVTPGLIDMHVHLRDPGQEYKETIQSGCMAAAYGGFTAVCCMPNTNPANDNRQVTEYIINQSKMNQSSRVYPVAAISRDLAGKELCEYSDLKDAGAIALSDDGHPVVNSLLMRRAMEYAKGLDLLLITHSEEPDLSHLGVMNEGPVATRLGLAGIPNVAESIMVLRDIALCELTGARLHIAHVSTKESLHAIRDAKKRGLSITAETAPHYFTLTDEDVREYDTHAKMNPPLRSKADQEAILEALCDGTIDVIATDHAPHSSLEKDVEFDQAANGIIGLETSLPLGLKLVKKKKISLITLIEKMAKNPARILNLENDVKIGRPADLTIIDLEYEHVVNAELFQSKSRNTPFDGWELTGKAILTMVGGQIIFSTHPELR